MRQGLKGLFTVVVKATKGFKKNSGGLASKFRNYLLEYVDEKGKQANWEGKTKVDRDYDHIKDKREDIISEEGYGEITIGGFLKEKLPPWEQEVFEEEVEKTQKKKEWVTKITRGWAALCNQELYNKRRKDLDRRIFSLDKEALKPLKDNAIPVEEFLNETVKLTFEKYKKYHKFEGDLGWIQGQHNDKEHIHLHISLFPTTEKGEPLRLSDKKFSKDEKDQHLTRFTAIANEAAREVWKELLPPKEWFPEQKAELLYDEKIEIPFSFYCQWNKNLTQFDITEADKFIEEREQTEKIVNKLLEENIENRSLSNLEVLESLVQKETKLDINSKAIKNILPEYPIEKNETLLGEIKAQEKKETLLWKRVLEEKTGKLGQDTRITSLLIETDKKLTPEQKYIPKTDILKIRSVFKEKAKLIAEAKELIKVIELAEDVSGFLKNTKTPLGLLLKYSSKDTNKSNIINKIKTLVKEVENPETEQDWDKIIKNAICRPKKKTPLSPPEKNKIKEFIADNIEIKPETETREMLDKVEINLSKEEPSKKSSKDSLLNILRTIKEKDGRYDLPKKQRPLI